MNREHAQNAIRAAAHCGAASCGITLIAAIIGLISGGFEYEGLNISPWLFADVIILLGLTAGMYFRNRLCAIAMAAYFIYSKYIQFSTGVNIVGFATAVTFLYFYIHAARAAFVLYKIDRIDAELYRNQKGLVGDAEKIQ